MFNYLTKNFFATMTTAGTIAGVYVGMEYGVERIRGTRDWVSILRWCHISLFSCLCIYLCISLLCIPAFMLNSSE